MGPYVLIDVWASGPIEMARYLPNDQIYDKIYLIMSYAAAAQGIIFDVDKVDMQSVKKSLALRCGSTIIATFSKVAIADSPHPSS